MIDNYNNVPLATFLRPKKLEDFVGHDNVVGPDSFLRKMIASDQISSLVFWGPPGTGKTTLALIIAKATKSEFKQISAVNTGVKDLKEIILAAEADLRFGKRTILFIDEIHRWNKSQQDALLPEIESGKITLIGATTENPSFALNSALLSRVKVIVLKALTNDDLSQIIKNAAKVLKVKVDKKITALIARFADGDARVAINILENCKRKSENINLESVKDIINNPNLLYDKKGDEHYNIISALHKSMRGGDATAAVYWMTRMLEGGEDPLYVARRMWRFASEDIGLANNSATMLASSVFDACKNIGLPECAVHLSHLAIYLAKSPKSVVAYDAYNLAKEEIAKFGALPVPVHLRNAPTKLMKELGYGQDYKYTPKVDSSAQEYLPPELKNSKLKKLIK
jgi:putative ATPase